MAADSKATYIGPGIKGPTNVCKLFRSGNFYFGVSGLAKDQNRNFFPEKTIADSFSDSTSFESNIDRMERAISHSLIIEMKRLKTEDPEQFESALKGEKYTLAVIAAFLDGDTAHMAGRAFKYLDETNPSIKIDRLTCPGDCPSEDYAFFAGGKGAAQKTLTELFKNPNWDPVESARKAVDSEIRASPETVGPPIRILAVGTNGVFIDPKQDGCPIALEPIK